MVRRHGSATSTARCREAAHANKRDPAPAPGPRQGRAGAGPRCPRPLVPVHAAVALACQRACTRRRARSPRKESSSGGPLSRALSNLCSFPGGRLEPRGGKTPPTTLPSLRPALPLHHRDEGSGRPRRRPYDIDLFAVVELESVVEEVDPARRIGSGRPNMNQHIILIVHQGRPMLRQYCSMASPSTNLLNPAALLAFQDDTCI